MPITDVLTSVLSGPAGKVVRGPLRSIVRDVLDERGFASPEEVQELRRQISSLEGRLADVQGLLDEAEALATTGQGELSRLADELEKAVRRAAVAEAAAPVATEPEPEPEPEPEVLEAQAEAPEPEPEVLEAQAEAPEEEAEGAVPPPPELPTFLEAELPERPDATDAPDASIAPMLAAQPKRCRVVACTEVPSRSGFCQDHLHAWSSGRLEGHVSPEGLIDVSGQPFRVDVELAGEAFAVSDTMPPMVEVGGMRVDALPLGM
jgi:hypothetical protein